MNITMVGTGYVGLVSGACFSEFGHDVTCVDKDASKIERLMRGEIPIYEPGLDDLVARNMKNGRLRFTAEMETAVAGSDAVFIAVGTPERRGDGHADLTYVHAAAREIASALKGYTVVVTKSTVPVGTGREVARIIREAAPEADFDIASNPEFLREGSAIEDFMRPNRVVCGADSERARAAMRALYRPLHLRETPIHFTTLESSELIKYASNAFLAVKISFINEIADLCEKTGANVQDVAKGMGLDQRIGAKFLHAGPGYGGSCFPKDTKALLRTGEMHGVPLRITEATVAVNDTRKKAMAGRIIDALGGSAAGKKIAVLGVTFKPNTDDMRDSPALDILPSLTGAGASISAFDPEGMGEAAKLIEGVTWCGGAYETMPGADILVIVTEWNQFRALDLERVRSLLARPVIVDFRNIYPPEEMAAAGFEYRSIGRRTAFPVQPYRA